MAAAITLVLADESATQALGARLGRALQALKAGAVIYLQGDLGAGKTCLARSLLRALGHAGAVVSPTYTIMEPYDVSGRRLLHVDLYRLSDPEELDFIGIDDQYEPQGWLLIEWPERGEGRIPAADLRVTLSVPGEGREAGLAADSARGQVLLERLADLSKIDGDTQNF
ncbi:MAG: tRNA (adenosine(37)-N6)-threonylcarbamoyltransferase complex ATPase subunit type 1 TsaE [Salinisphaeraceae bacterium]|nr:tRNA (adenosine(37)-N6)-threonylcarbamoyltransferase complex ATPase subunit type 1 TsaE [Salinisphaeraceae bacterium]